MLNKGMRSVCIREVQKSLKDSAKRLIEDKLQKFGLGEKDGFKVFRELIETPGGGVITFQGMQDHTAESVKSMENIGRAWVEEAQTLSARSLELLRPTIRAEGSELWFSWNPRRPTDPVDQMLRGPKCPSDAVVVAANWNANPWFPKVLDAERRESQRNDPDRYGHIWEGEYARVFEGAYFASHLEIAEREGRVTDIAKDGLLPVKCFWDIGGTSNKSDATAIWVVQTTSEKVRVLDYYEAVGQEFSEHVHWLRVNGWGEAEQILPHDGRKHDVVFMATPAGYLTKAGFKTRVMDNIGAGAAQKRIEAARQVFPKVWFNEAKTRGGREALAWYHERRDEERGIGLGPDHDWSSHAADAFGGLCLDYLARPERKTDGPLRRRMKGIA